MTSLSQSFDHLRTRWPVLQQIDSGLVIGLIIAMLCLGIFAATAEDVQENDYLVEVDHAIADELHQQGHLSPETVAAYKIISAIGLPGIWVMGLIVGLFFVLRRQWLHLVIWSMTLVSGILLNNVIKLIFARARPVFEAPFVIEENFSFPSGHAMCAVIGFGLLAYFLCLGSPSRIARIIIVFATTLLILLIGISRMALGVHFFSDVIGGFAAGGAWLTLCITLLDQLSRRQLKKDAAPKQSAL